MGLDTCIIFAVASQKRKAHFQPLRSNQNKNHVLEPLVLLPEKNLRKSKSFGNKEPLGTSFHRARVKLFAGSRATLSHGESFDRSLAGKGRKKRRVGQVSPRFFQSVFCSRVVQSPSIRPYGRLAQVYSFPSGRTRYHVQAP